MWDINIRKGTIWSIKSLNEYDDYYEGMKYGSYKVLILSAYINQYNESEHLHFRWRGHYHG